MNSIAAKPLAETQVVSLTEAVLCVDCEMVSNSTQGHCLACGSRALLNIATALGGPLHATSVVTESASNRFTAAVAPGRVVVLRNRRRRVQR